MARYLVTGGAGFVGSHLVLALIEQGATVMVLDDLRQGHRAALQAIGLPEDRLLIGRVGDPACVAAALARGPYDAVLHFAALSVVGESMADPFLYLRENAVAGAAFIEACALAGVPRFVLSSTAAVYGTPDAVPIGEHAPVQPENPYGDSKRFLERALHWADHAHGMRYAALRYFNAAGADPGRRLGEHHRPETHLIPRAIDAALGRTGPLEVFGTDYPTEDGTCVRDYVHVSDLAAAHLAVLALPPTRSVVFNVGIGAGHSVRAVIAAVTAATGRAVPWIAGPRRPGDPARLVADPARLQAATGWLPRRLSLAAMVTDAAVWRLAHPDGYSTS